jgi:hypothetical protein
MGMRLHAIVAVAAVGAGALVAPAPAYAAPACSIDYQITDEWTGEFNGKIVINNVGDVQIKGWTLYWVFPAGQKIVKAWNVGSVTQNGAEVTTTDAGWNALVPPKESTSIGFTASWVVSNPEPTTFAVNGLTCGVV